MVVSLLIVCILLIMLNFLTLYNVSKDIGMVQSLAEDTKSLKNALTNVKERGIYGEVMLEKLLEDIFTPEQYEAQVEIESGNKVDFVIKLPHNSFSDGEPLLLPIDSKFPIKDYSRLIDAQDKDTIESARKDFKKTILNTAKNINKKYIYPPKTTDFALMFLPTEGLYTEVVRDTQLFEELRRKYKVTPVGAVTLSAFLSALQVGFKTLKIEQQSSDVIKVLENAKREFINLEKTLNKAKKQIETLDKTITKIVGPITKEIVKSLENIEISNETKIDETD